MKLNIASFSAVVLTFSMVPVFSVSLPDDTAAKDICRTTLIDDWLASPPNLTDFESPLEIQNTSISAQVKLDC